MQELPDLAEQAQAFQQTDLTGSHQAFRDYAQTTRAMLADIALTLDEDAREAARWLRRQRHDPDGRPLPVARRLLLARRLRAAGRNAAEAYAEAAKAIVRMAAVHQQYMRAEQLADAGTAASLTTLSARRHQARIELDWLGETDEACRHCQEQHARDRVRSAQRALKRAEAGGDQDAIAAARERVANAQDIFYGASVRAGAHAPDMPNQAGLRRAEREAVSAYTGGESSAINQYVQNGYRLPAYAADDHEYEHYMSDTVAALEHAVNQSRLATPTTVTRAIHTHSAEQAYGPARSAQGKTITEHRFVSTTLNATPPREFGEATVIYRLSPGTRALAINSSGVACKRDENEVLLGPHQSFRVVFDDVVGGQRVIHMESAPTDPQDDNR